MYVEWLEEDEIGSCDLVQSQNEFFEFQICMKREVRKSHFLKFFFGTVA
jgi:hypothetical protein